MATFTEIVKESEATRHEVYFLQAGDKKFFAPSPAKEQEKEQETLKQLRKEEQQARAKEMAKLVHAGGIDKCEELGVDIANLLGKPEHITETDGSMPIMLNLIQKIVAE